MELALRLCVDELAPWAGITPDDGLALARAVADRVDLLVPVVGILTAWLVLGERPTAIELLGGVLVIAGVLWSGRRPRGAVAVPRVEGTDRLEGATP